MVIDSLFKARLVDCALFLFAKTKMKNIQLDVYTFIPLIHTLLIVSRWREVVRLLGEMKG